jgi:hypothetical protein
VEGLKKMISISNFSTQGHDNQVQLNENSSSIPKKCMMPKSKEFIAEEKLDPSKDLGESHYKKLDHILSRISSRVLSKENPESFDLKEIHIKQMDYILKTMFYSSWTEVKNFFENQEHKPKDQQKSVQMILSYREKVVHDILDQVKEELPQEIINQKLNFLNEKNIDHTNPLYAKFLNIPIKPLFWSDYGSKDPSSDIDITLKGDYTQFAVKLFNKKMALRFDQKEPGILFDANVYSENCIPDINKSDFSQNLRQEFLNKEYPELKTFNEKSIEDYLSQHSEKSDHYNSFLSQMKAKPSYQKFVNLKDPRLQEVADKIEFVKNPQLKKDTLIFFETASLTKIRRYMSQMEWKDFSEQLIKAFAENGLDKKDIRKKLMKAEFTYFNNIAILKEGLSKVSRKKRFDVEQESAKTESGSWEDMMNKNKKNEAYIQKFPPNLVMSAENRLYEEKLSLSSKIKMNLDWYDMNHPDGKLDYNREKLVKELEEAQCDSKYFANEAYITPASLLSVVINKQMLSRGLYPQKQFKEKYFKIPLSVHEHLISLNEQLGDFFKESTRNLETNHPFSIEESVGLKSGKYIHRYANSYQSIYEALNIKDEMKLDRLQLKACSSLEALKKDARNLEQKAGEIRGSINAIFEEKDKLENHHPLETIGGKKTPVEELNGFKKLLIRITVQAYVDAYKHDNFLSNK